MYPKKHIHVLEKNMERPRKILLVVIYITMRERSPKTIVAMFLVD